MAERLFLRLADDESQGPESDAPPDTLFAAEVSPRLSEFVSSVLFYREQFPPGVQVVERVLPDGAVRLVFNLGDAPGVGEGQAYRAEAIGPDAVPALVRLRGRMFGVSVTLRPGAARALLGISASEIAFGAVPLDDLWRGDGARLLEQLAAAPDDHTRAQMIEAVLLGRTERARDTGHQRAIRAARLITQSGGALAVSQLAASLGVGERRIEQLFKEHVGLTPRLWRRLARLHTCLRLLRDGPPRSLATLAADAGYYDQAHLANEFKSLCGLSPSAFLQRTISDSSKTSP